MEQWFYSPEDRRYRGFIYDDILDRFNDGTFIHTSAVDHVEDNLVFTSSKNVYQLGEKWDMKDAIE